MLAKALLLATAASAAVIGERQSVSLPPALI
jgi:hypothetical protein